MKILENFDVEEFVHPAVFKAVGWPKVKWYVSPFQLKFAFLLRETLDTPILLNDWHRGGKLVGRGYRPPSYKPKGGGSFSQHYMSNALDVSTRLYSPREIFDAINKDREKFRLIGLTTIENLDSTPTWLHGDCRPIIPGVHPTDGSFLIVNPQ